MSPVCSPELFRQDAPMHAAVHNARALLAGQLDDCTVDHVYGSDKDALHTFAQYAVVIMNVHRARVCATRSTIKLLAGPGAVWAMRHGTYKGARRCILLRSTQPRGCAGGTQNRPAASPCGLCHPVPARQQCPPQHLRRSCRTGERTRAQ